MALLHYGSFQKPRDYKMFSSPVDEPVVLSLRKIPIKGIFNGPAITADKNRPQNTNKQNPAKKCFRFSNVDGTYLPFTNDLRNLSG